MAGSLIERSLGSGALQRSMGSGMNNMGNFRRPNQQMNPQTMQTMAAPQFPQMMMPESYGASRFLTGNLGIPLNYGVDVPAYTPFSMTPGPFADFMAAQNFSDSSNPVIPVFDPRTGRYTSSVSNSLPSSFSPDSGIPIQQQYNVGQSGN